MAIAKMGAPTVSVIIPTYNAARYLGEAVRSVLAQTHANLEVVVVDDASTDETAEVMGQFSDSRVTYVVHPENRYTAAARNTGIRATSGDLLAFLDADDVFHPEKLAAHVELLARHPDVGLCYGRRIEVDAGGRPLALVVPPPKVTLPDLVMGYPYAPSEVVMRRSWALAVGLFDEGYSAHGEDPDFHMRLALQGCPMVAVDGALTYRRLHPGRTFNQLARIVEGEVRAFERTFADPRCPSDVRDLRDRWLAQLCIIWSCIALAQDEVDLGRGLIGQAIRHDPAIAGADDERWPGAALFFSVRDGGDHEAVLRRIWTHLPPALEAHARRLEPAIARGYLNRALRDALWERPAEAGSHGARAAALGASLEAADLGALSWQLLAYEDRFGRTSGNEAIKRVRPVMAHLGTSADVRRFLGQHAINRAFMSYHAGRYGGVPGDVLRGVIRDPRFAVNRGVLKVFFRSGLHLLHVWPAKREDGTP